MRFSPAPYRETAVQLQTASTSLLGMLTRPWERWFSLLEAAIKTLPTTVASASLTAQAASIAATTIYTAQANRYRVLFYARITTAATTSSSLTLTVNWTDDGVACTRSGAAMTGNTTGTTTTFNNNALTIEVDPGSVIQYETTYASVGATAMQYKLDVMVQELP